MDPAVVYPWRTTMSDLLLITARTLQAGAHDAEERPGALLLDRTSGTIAATGAAALARRAEAAAADDFPDAVLFPALVDTHAHLVQDGDGMPGPELVNIPEEKLVARSLKNASRALRGGVAVLEDQGGRGRATLLARASARRDPTNYPELLVAGPAITKPGGHMWYLDGEAGDAAAIGVLARRLLDDGVDIIKLVASGGGTPGTIAHEVQYSAAELREGVAAAHERGRKATAHCNCILAIENAVEAEVDLIHHANFFDEQGVRRFDRRVAERIAASGVFVDPTLWVTYSLFDGACAGRRGRIAQALAGPGKGKTPLGRKARRRAEHV
jgi:imidazolonepropionase-like amidohydrolase